MSLKKMGLKALEKMIMLWSKAVLLSGAIMLFSGVVFAEKVSCSDVLTINANSATDKVEQRGHRGDSK